MVDPIRVFFVRIVNFIFLAFVYCQQFGVPTAEFRRHVGALNLHEKTCHCQDLRVDVHAQRSLIELAYSYSCSLVEPKFLVDHLLPKIEVIHATGQIQVKTQIDHQIDLSLLHSSHLTLDFLLVISTLSLPQLPQTISELNNNALSQIDLVDKFSSKQDGCLRIHESIEIVIVQYFGLHVDEEHRQLYSLLLPIGCYPLQFEDGGPDQLVQFHREADVIGEIGLKRKQSHKLIVKLYDITIKSKLFLHANPRLYLCNPLLKQCQLILQP